MLGAFPIAKLVPSFYRLDHDFESLYRKSGVFARDQVSAIILEEEFYGCEDLNWALRLCDNFCAIFESAKLRFPNTSK